MSVEDFEVTVSDAFAATLESPSVVVVREQYDRQGDLISRSWTDYRQEEGASVHFEPSDDEESDRYLQAAVETEDFFAAVDNRFDKWTVGTREPDSVTSPRRIRLMMDDSDVPYLPDEESMHQEFIATRQDMSDGGVLWSASTEADFVMQSQSWRIHPDGHVRGYRLEVTEPDEFGGVPTPPGFPVVIEANLQPVDDPAPLPEPDEGDSMDLSVFPLPDDFLSEPGRGAAAG